LQKRAKTSTDAHAEFLSTENTGGSLQGHRSSTVRFIVGGRIK
jgi:hypothetical protein